MYRPEGWEDKKDELVSSALEQTTSYIEDMGNMYEAGADAMLEGLREEGKVAHIEVRDKRGVVVFIPDD